MLLLFIDLRLDGWVFYAQYLVSHRKSDIVFNIIRWRIDRIHFYILWFDIMFSKSKIYKFESTVMTLVVSVCFLRDLSMPRCALSSTRH